MIIYILIIGFLTIIYLILLFSLIKRSIIQKKEHKKIIELNNIIKEGKTASNVSLRPKIRKANTNSIDNNNDKK